MGLLVAAVGLWLANQEPVFRGKTEGEWIAEILGNKRTPPFRDDPLRDQFVEMGPDAARFLGAALGRRNSAAGSFYRSLYFQLPKSVAVRLPSPSKRINEGMAILSLLGRMGTNALPAETEIAHCLRAKDLQFVMFAVTCYPDDMVGGWGGLFATMDEETRKLRSPDMAAALAFTAAQPRNAGSPFREDRTLRQLCQILGNQRELVPPVLPTLTNLFIHPNDMVQAAAWHAVARLDKDAAIRMGAVKRAVRFLEDPPAILLPGLGGVEHPSTQDFGADILGDLVAEPDVSLPVLMKAAQGQNLSVAHSAINALRNYTANADQVGPVLVGLLKGNRGPNSAAIRQALRKIDPKTADDLGLP